MGTPHAENDERVLDRLRAICLRFPEVEERGGVGNPSFKVRGKIFAMRHSLHEIDRWSLGQLNKVIRENVVIAANPEAFGNESLGGADAQMKDRRVTIVFTR